MTAGCWPRIPGARLLVGHVQAPADDATSPWLGRRVHLQGAGVYGQRACVREAGTWFPDGPRSPTTTRRF